MTSDQAFGVLVGLLLLGAFLIVLGRILRAPLPTASPPAARVSAGTVRARGASALGEAVGLFWPSPLPAGAMTCMDCIESGRWAMADGRPDDDRAIVLRGEGARLRAVQRCATCRPRIGLGAARS